MPMTASNGKNRLAKVFKWIGIVLLFLIVIAGVSYVGFGYLINQSMGTTTKTFGTADEAKASQLDGTFYLNGNEYHLGTATLQDFLDNGWKCEQYHEPDETLAAKKNTLLWLQWGDTSDTDITIYIANTTDESIPSINAVVFDIEVNEEGQPITFPGGISIGDTCDKVLETYGGTITESHDHFYSTVRKSGTYSVEVGGETYQTTIGILPSTDTLESVQYKDASFENGNESSYTM